MLDELSKRGGIEDSNTQGSKMSSGEDNNEKRRAGKASAASSLAAMGTLAARTCVPSSRPRPDGAKAASAPRTTTPVESAQLDSAPEIPPTSAGSAEVNSHVGTVEEISVGTEASSVQVPSMDSVEEGAFTSGNPMAWA